MECFRWLNVKNWWDGASDTRRQNTLAKLKIVWSFWMKQVQILGHHIKDLSRRPPSPPFSMLKHAIHARYQVWEICHSTLKLGGGGCFRSDIMILRQKIVVLPTILSSGVWGAIPSIFDIQSCKALHLISGASFGLENVFTTISKIFDVVTSFYDVIIFFAMLPKIATKAQFGHHDILGIH